MQSVNYPKNAPEHILSALKTLFEKLDKAKEDWTKEKLQDLETELE